MSKSAKETLDSIIEKEFLNHTLTEDFARAVAEQYAATEVSRLLDYLDTWTANEQWTFSMDLGGATESGFAWEKREISDYGDHAVSPIIQGKDKASLLAATKFDTGYPRDHWLVEVGTIKEVDS